MAAFTDYRALDFSGIDKVIDNYAKRQELSALGQNVDGSPEGYTKAALALLGKGDIANATNFLALGEKARERAATENAYKSSPFSTPALPSSPTAPTAAKTASLGDPSAVENEFVGTVKQAGLTNPVGLGAVAAYGRAESGFSPQNANRTWSDPSQSGQPGTAGGIMSWRADRLQNLYKFAQSQGEQPGNISPKTQALFLAQEDPTLLPKLQAAKTPDEANQIMANAWRFAGYDQPGGENARRLALTQQYAQRYGGQAGAQAGMPTGVQVANNEADVQRLEAQQGNPIIASPASVQMAEAAPMPGQPQADVPAQGAAAAGFNVPGSGLPPNDPYPTVKTEALVQVIRNPYSSPGDKALAQKIWADRQAYTAENAPDKRALAKAQAEKAQLDLEEARKKSGGFRTLITPEERAQYGVDPNYKGTAQVGPDNRVVYPGKATTEINIDQKSETAYATANGKAISDRFSKIVEEGDAANQEVGVLNQLRNLGGQIKNMGSGAALQAKLAEYGIKVGSNVSEIEAYTALVDKLTPQQRIAGAGATSDFDAKMFKSSLPGLMRTPAGNELILGTLEALNTYKRQRGDIVAEAMATNEKPAEVIKKLKELPDPFAAFKEARKQGGGAPTAGANPPAPPAPAEAPAGFQPQPGPTPPAPPSPRQAPVRVQSPDEAMKLPKGTPIILPDGRIGEVP